MRIKRTSRLIMLALVAASVVSIGTFLQAARYLELRRQAHVSLLASAKAIDGLVRGSESLAAAVRAYSVTGDQEFVRAFDRLLHVDRVRERELERLGELGITVEEQRIARRAKARSDDLVRFAQGILATPRFQTRDAGLHMAFGPEFRELEQQVLAEVSELRATVEARHNAEVARLTANAGLATYLALGFLLVNLGLVAGSVVFFFQGKVVDRVVALTRQTKRVAAGDWNVRFVGEHERSEFGDLARTLEGYRHASEERENERWVKVGLAEITVGLHRAETPDEFGRQLVSRLAPMLSCGAAACYVRGESNAFSHDTPVFDFAGGYGLQGDLGHQRFALGEGVVGQAAREGKPVVIRNVPTDVLRVVTGLGEAPPSVVVAVPILFDDRPLAVVVLAGFGAPNERQWSLVKDLSGAVGPRLGILLRNRRTQQLLQATSKQAGLLEEQAATLQHQTEKLQEQTAALESQKAAITATEAWYWAIIESAPDGMLVADQEGTILLTNPQLDRIFGYDRGALRGRKIETLVPKALRSAHAGKRDGALAAGAARRIEATEGVVEGVRRDGTPVPVEIGLSMLPALEGRDACVCASVRDVTEKHERDREVRLLLAEQQAIFDNAPVGMIYVADHVVLRANPRMAQMFGVDLGSILGQDTRIFFADAADRDAFLESMAGPLADGRPAHCEWEANRPDGSRFWASWTLQRLELPGQTPTTIATIEDVTERRQLDAEIRRARDLAEEASRVKADFLANMSHEIRTPMNVIVGSTHLALRTTREPRQREHLLRIQHSSQHLLGVINDILDFSRIEAGKLLIDRTDFELSQVLDDVANLIREKAGAKGLELVFEVARDVPDNLVGDPLRLGQVLINYGNNAVKFTDRGEIHVGVQKQEEAAGSVLLRFTVTDTGIGITEEQIPRLFQSFQQADTSTSRKYGGSGLGLAICKQLAQLMGGAVGVESTYGKGSTFWFTARLAKSERQPKGLHPVPELRGRRVLVVDDNDHARSVLGDLLTSLEFKVQTAASGEEAISAVRSAVAGQVPFEVVLLDWRMPGLNGVETARRIAALGLDAPPHVLLVTAYGREDVVRSAEAAGIESVLIKPVSSSLLFDTMMHVLGASPAPGEHAPSPMTTLEASLSQLRGARILLVEDNELNQQVASELLRDAGLTVDIAENGRVALDTLGHHDYALVLMDMQMPVMDGIAATREIRCQPHYASLPIVAMTANAMGEHRDQCLAAGMNDHVAKPIDPEELWAALLRWIPAEMAATASGGGALPRLRVVTGGAATGERTEAAADQGDVPADVPGLDTTAGLRRVSGKRGFYRSLLQRFADGQAGAADGIRAALGADDRATARRLAHTLRGVAGNVGAVRVEAAAQRVESAIAHDGPDEAVWPALAELADVLDAVVGALRARLCHGPRAVTRAAGTDPERAQHATRRLAELLEQGDTHAAAVLHEDEDALLAAYGDGLVPVKAAIVDFDYERALSALHQAARGRRVAL
jgi:PAS domain S-box-containing protein